MGRWVQIFKELRKSESKANRRKTRSRTQTQVTQQTNGDWRGSMI